MLFPVKGKYNKATATFNIDEAEQGRARNAVLEIVNRQIGVVYGLPSELYAQIGYSSDLASEIDVVAFYQRKTQDGVQYAIAIRLRASGAVEILLPDQNATWIPYAIAGPLVGKIFAEARKDFQNGKIPNTVASNIKTTPAALACFVERTITSKLDGPSIILIEADNWRNKNCWSQLANPHLPSALHELRFGTDNSGSKRIYGRKDTAINHVLGIVRMRTDDETPQYITSRKSWTADQANVTRDLFELTGFIDQTVQQVFHYFSVGRLPDTIKGPQMRKKKHDPYKIDDGGGIPFKHQQLVEMVPFFVCDDLNNQLGLTAICRVPHYLRSSPGWAGGNLALPYPMHLAKTLIEDQLCILGTSF